MENYWQDGIFWCSGQFAEADSRARSVAVRIAPDVPARADFPKPLYMGSFKVWDRAAIEAWKAKHVHGKQIDARLLF